MISLQLKTLRPMGNFGSRASTTTSRSSSVTTVFSSAFGSSEPEWGKNNVKTLIAENKLAPIESASDDNDEECPICFMNFSAVNTTSCCKYELCTGCYVQLNSSAENLQQKTCSCPFCGKDSLVVNYHPKAAKTTIPKNNKPNEDPQATVTGSTPTSGPASSPITSYVTTEQNQKLRSPSLDVSSGDREIPLSSTMDRADIEEQIRIQRRLYPEDRANPQPRPSRGHGQLRSNYYNSHNTHNNVHLRGMSSHDGYTHGGSSYPLPPSSTHTRSNGPGASGGSGSEHPLLQRLHHSSSVYRAPNSSGNNNNNNNNNTSSSSAASTRGRINNRLGGGPISRVTASDHFAPEVFQGMMENGDGGFRLTTLQQLEDMMLMAAIRQSMLDTQPAPAPSPPRPLPIVTNSSTTFPPAPANVSPRPSPPRSPHRLTPPRTPVSRMTSSSGSYGNLSNATVSTNSPPATSTSSSAYASFSPSSSSSSSTPSSPRTTGVSSGNSEAGNEPNGVN